MGFPSDYVVVGCGKRKATEPRPARDLYTGSLFTAARRYAEASFLPWRILSAKHGLVDPDQVLEPYDAQLLGPYWEKPELRACVGLQLAQLGWSGVLEVHAGHEYAELVRVEAAYTAPGLRVVSPVAGLQVGQRLAWYRAERERRATS